MSARPDIITVCTVESVEYSFLIYYSVNLQSDVYFFCLVAELFSALSAVCLCRLCWIRAFVCLAFVWQFMFIRICCLGGDACLLSGNPKMRNPEPEKTDENHNLESTNQRKQFLQTRENLLCRASKFNKSSNKNSLWVEICATVISSEGYDYENRNKVRC